jgi:hypothetical protein
MVSRDELVGTVFLSYRRGPGASEAAGRLHDRLESRYGTGTAYMDVDAVRPGTDFVDAIQEAVDSSRALIAIVDPNWAVDVSGRNRIQDPNDYVRLEVGTALRRGVMVIPVLVQGAEMPATDLLPPDLQPLTRRQAVVLSHERFNTDVIPLERELDELLAAPPPQAEERPTPEPVEAPPAVAAAPERLASLKEHSRAWVAGLVITVVAVAAVAIGALTIGGDPDSPPEGGAIRVEGVGREGDIVFVTVKNYGDEPASTFVSCEVVTPDGARPPFGIDFIDVPPGITDTGEGEVPPGSEVGDCWLP